MGETQIVLDNGTTLHCKHASHHIKGDRVYATGITGSALIVPLARVVYIITQAA